MPVTSLYLAKDYTANATFSFTDFTCSVADCCNFDYTSYSIVDATSLAPLSSVSCCTNSAGGSYKGTIGVTAVSKFDMKVKGTNLVG